MISSVLEDLKARTKLESEEYNSRLQVNNVILINKGVRMSPNGYLYLIPCTAKNNSSVLANFK